MALFEKQGLLCKKKWIFRTVPIEQDVDELDYAVVNKLLRTRMALNNKFATIGWHLPFGKASQKKIDKAVELVRQHGYVEAKTYVGTHLLKPGHNTLLVGEEYWWNPEHETGEQMSAVTYFDTTPSSVEFGHFCNYHETGLSKEVIEELKGLLESQGSRITIQGDVKKSRGMWKQDVVTLGEEGIQHVRPMWRRKQTTYVPYSSIRLAMFSPDGWKGKLFGPRLHIYGEMEIHSGKRFPQGRGQGDRSAFGKVHPG